MKHNPLVSVGLIGAWILMLLLLIELHWRPARVMLPIVSVILLVYIGACTVHAILRWLDEKKEEEKKNGSESGTVSGGADAKPKD